MAREYRSQYSYDGEHADSGPRRILPGDIADFLVLNPERYAELPCPWYHALAHPNKNYFRFAKRTAMWARAPHQYLERHQVAFKHGVYSRTEKGDRLVNEPNPARSKQPRAHQLLQDMVHASIELGARKLDGFEFVDWLALKNRGWTERGLQKYIPDKTLDQPDPHLIKLKRAHSHADGRPFLLKHARNQIFILGTEIDRSTEPLETTHTSRRSIKQKFEQYAEIFDEDLYKNHYGFPNSLVLFVFISETRMRSAMALLKSRPYIVFYHWKDWYHERSFPPPTDYIFTAAGKRAGHPDFRLSKFWES